METQEIVEIVLAVLTVLFAASEALSLTPRFKSNGVIQLIYNISKALLRKGGDTNG